MMDSLPDMDVKQSIRVGAIIWHMEQDNLLVEQFTYHGAVTAIFEYGVAFEFYWGNNNRTPCVDHA